MNDTIKTLSEIEAADRAALVQYLQAWGFQCYGHETTEDLRTAARENFETEGEAQPPDFGQEGVK